jgi:hypothetical protein
LVPLNHFTTPVCITISFRRADHKIREGILPKPRLETIIETRR